MVSSNYPLYNVDIVFCIDATGSMIPHIDRVKKNALQFHADVVNICKSKEKIVDKLRIRVIAYRDFYCDDEPFIPSPFFSLPEQAKQYRDFVENIQAKDGGDEPENGLEALFEAMRSDWQKEGARRRQVIVVFTDASCHPLEQEGKKPNYPKGMPKDINELTDYWDGQSPLMHPTYKRLILFAPNLYPWPEIAESWEVAIHHPAEAGKGLSESDYSTILMAIANSI